MAQLTGHDVVELVTVQIAGAEDRMERIYEWQFDRLMAVVRVTALISASIVATLARRSSSHHAVRAYCLLAAVAIGVFSFARLVRIRRE